MAWKIESIEVPSNHSYVIMGADCQGRDGVYHAGTIFTSKVMVIVPGIGYIQLTSGPGSGKVPSDLSVKVSNSSTNWFYRKTRGPGAARLTVYDDGRYTIAGGLNTINSKVVRWKG